MAKEENLGEIFVKIKADVDSLEKEVSRLKGQMKKDAEKMGKSFADTFKKGLKLAGSFLGLKAALDFGKKIINTASEFEQLKTRLVSLYGSVDKATDVFAKFKKIAATTPFSLKNVVQAGATLKAFGMDAENTLKSVTDLAAFMGLDVVEAAQAVGRAFAGGVGAADVLRERGVLNLIKSFKGIDDLTKLTLPEFRKALIEAMQDPAAGIAGATDRMSQTFAGAMSNMGDALENLAAKIGTVFIPFLKSAAKGITELVSPSKSLYEQWKEQGARVKTLNNQMPGLIAKYEELKPLAKGNAEKHREMQSVLNQIADIMPTAITQWDKYGNALAFSKDKVKELLEAEKARLQFINKEAIKEAETKKQVIQYKIEQLDEETNSGFKDVTLKSRGEVRTIKVRLTPEEIQENRKELAGLQKDLEGVNAQIAHLKGEEYPSEKNKKGVKDLVEKWTAAGKTIGEIKQRIAELQQAQDGMLPGSKELKKNMAEIARLTALIKIKKEVFKPAEGSIANLRNRIDYLRSKLTKLDPNSTMFFTVARQIGILEVSLDRLESKVKSFKEGVIGGLPDVAEKILEELENTIPEEIEQVEIPIDIAPSSESENNMPISISDAVIDWMDGLDVMRDATEGFMEATSQTFYELIHIGLRRDATEMQRIWTGLANAIIAEIERIAIKWAMLNLISLATGNGFVSLSSMFTGGATGGTFFGTSTGVKKAASGASFVVPAGFPNDSYPMRVQTGERVDVTPANKVGEMHRTLGGIYNSIKVLNENMIDLMLARPNEVAVRTYVEGEIGNDAIYLSNRKQSKLRARYGG